MTTRPEDAMTRERVLEEALRPFAALLKQYARTAKDEWKLDELVHQGDLYLADLTIGDLRAAKRALASTRQEPARKYGPTEWPERVLREVYPSPGSPADLANREPAPAADAEEVDRQIDSILERHQGAMTKAEYKAAGDEIRALIRRYAGDGGDTAGWQLVPAKLSEKMLAVLDCGGAARSTIAELQKRIAELEAHKAGWQGLQAGTADVVAQLEQALAAERQRRKECEAVATLAKKQRNDTGIISIEAVDECVDASTAYFSRYPSESDNRTKVAG